jgi:hypothetical protein
VALITNCRLSWFSGTFVSMFYGKQSGEAGAGRGNRNERYDQMIKQQQLIEQKKQEIQARLEMERQKKAMELLSKPTASRQDGK